MSKPYGINQINIKRGEQVVQLPVAQSLEFEERIVSGELPGDDGLQAVAAHTNGVTWKLKAGGISLDAYALITDRTVSQTGSTPNVVRTLESGGVGKRMPYFEIYGKSLGDGDDDAWIHIINAKITEGVKGTMGDKEFFVTEIGGMALDWEKVEHETAQDLPEGGAAPAFTLTSVPEDADIDVAVDANVVLTFSNALAYGAEDAIILTTAAGMPVAAVRTINAARKIVTLNPASDLGAATDYLVIVPNVTDVYGQALADTVIDFTTAA
jgi:hypothetical protein